MTTRCGHESSVIGRTALLASRLPSSSHGMMAHVTRRALRGALAHRQFTIRPPWQQQRCMCSSRPVRSQQQHAEEDVPEWASDEARAALLGFRQKVAKDASGEGGLVSEYVQTLDANQIHLLRITQASMVPLGGGEAASRDDDAEAALRKREERILTADGVRQAGVPRTSPLVPTEHLAFFTPRVAAQMLGADGSDTSFNPPGGIFTRRMWAGGKMTWDGESKKTLCVGDEAWERTYVEGAQLKQLAGGRGEMIVVWVRKTFGAAKNDAVLLTDRRSWVFQRALTGKPKQPPQQQQRSDADVRPQAPPKSDLLMPTLQRQTPASLFRYSALTFNAHAIHLSPPWARDVEGHANVVVHGPLNLGLLVRKWGRELAGWQLADDGSFAAQKATRTLRSVEYRAKRPVYAEQPYWIGIRPSQDTDDEQRHTVVAMHVDGTVAMEATITSSPIK